MVLHSVVFYYTRLSLFARLEIQIRRIMCLNLFFLFCMCFTLQFKKKFPQCDQVKSLVANNVPATRVMESSYLRSEFCGQRRRRRPRCGCNFCFMAAGVHARNSSGVFFCGASVYLRFIHYAFSSFEERGEW